MMIYMSMIDSAEDRSKFERVYLKYKDLMFCAANRILHNTHDAEDAVHQAFLSILKHLDKIITVDSQKTRVFVVVIVERKAIDLLRSRNRMAETVLLEEITATPAAEPLGLVEAIEQLPEHYRNALTLKYVMGLSNSEMAKLLGITSSGISKLLFRAKAALKDILRKDGVTL